MKHISKKDLVEFLRDKRINLNARDFYYYHQIRVSDFENFLQGEKAIEIPDDNYICNACKTIRKGIIKK